MRKRKAMSLPETVLALFIMSVVLVGMLQVMASLEQLPRRVGAASDFTAQVETLLDEPTTGAGELAGGFHWQRTAEPLTAKKDLYHVQLTLMQGERQWSFETVVRESGS